ncbi:hypothetical protein GALMADRAFT_279124 [Galerina marginata CBS 339.88]|uniref:Uncharacterized protein n=1 Tax=Galerina marginata (strain CBS 339.88) TaxID=685588 RepID=A0A067T993_GALM3|nr:hypothetical protein GALMADRAFT_279124 [Galerina marginata CBS 339.88]
MHRDSKLGNARASYVTEVRSVERLSQDPPEERYSDFIPRSGQEEDIFRRKSQSESDASGASQSTGGVSTPQTPIPSLAPLPTQRSRVRRPKTKEARPTESQTLIALGMSPFMPVQDAMFNQNRLVRNETILAQHVSRLQNSYSSSEANHAKWVQDIYRILTDHNAAIDKQMADLLNAHVETHNALNNLLHEFSSFSASTKSTIDRLNDSIRKLAAGTPIVATESSSTTASVQTETIPQRLPSFGNLSLPEIADYSVHGMKRKREGFSAGPFTGASTSIAASRTEISVIAQEVYLPRSDYSVSEDTFRDVIYGPINNAGDHLSSGEIVNEAIRSVGLSTSMVQTILSAPRNPGFLTVRFLKQEYASSRKVEVKDLGNLMPLYLAEHSAVGCLDDSDPDSLQQTVLQCKKPYRNTYLEFTLDTCATKRTEQNKTMSSRGV